MKTLIKIMASATAVAAIAVSMGPVFADSNADPNVGTWKLNVGESIAPQGTVFHPYTVIIRSTFPVLDYTYYGVDDKGGKVEFSWKAVPDGKVRDIPGIQGLRGSMTRLPSGIVDAKLWSADGTFENKFCMLGVTLRRQTCMAQVTSSNGNVAFFKQIIDKQR